MQKALGLTDQDMQGLKEFKDYADIITHIRRRIRELEDERQLLEKTLYVLLNAPKELKE